MPMAEADEASHSAASSAAARPYSSIVTTREMSGGGRVFEPCGATPSLAPSSTYGVAKRSTKAGWCHVGREPILWTEPSSGRSRYPAADRS